MPAFMRQRVDHLLAERGIFRRFLCSKDFHVGCIEHHHRHLRPSAQHRRGHSDPHSDLVVCRLQRPADGHTLIDRSERLVVVVRDNNLLKPFQVEDFPEEMKPCIDRFADRSRELFRRIATQVDSDWRQRRWQTCDFFYGFLAVIRRFRSQIYSVVHVVTLHQHIR